MPIEDDYDIRFISKLALREKQNQQSYRPIIGVHKWFARRPGTLFRGLLLSEFGEGALEDTYFRANSLKGVSIADPFIGGGTPLLEANRLGCNVIGVDINPMAAWIVREEIDDIDLSAYGKATERFIGDLSQRVGRFYKTRCPMTGREDADVKYFLWVKRGTCRECLAAFDLFPGYVVADDTRHSAFVLVCPGCGGLNDVGDPHRPGLCSCGARLTMAGPVQRGKCRCPHCGHVNFAPFQRNGPPSHRLFAIEYFNGDLKGRAGRLFKVPDEQDLWRIKDVEETWRRMRPRFVPDDSIPEGDESSRLRRWGYEYFRDLFNPRQLFGLEMSARMVDRIEDARVRKALATNLSDILRYQNMLCRYDTMALKSLDIFSIHGFSISYIQAESNMIGVLNAGGIAVGSGGWINIIQKYTKAKRFCRQPFEVALRDGKRSRVPIPGEWIGIKRSGGARVRARQVDIRCSSATEIALRRSSLDGVFTDPPYFGMVQYGELMQFCYVWLRKLMGRDIAALRMTTTRHPQELTGNRTAERGLASFAEGLSKVFSIFTRALKADAPFVFPYHHNGQNAYLGIGVAVLDAGLSCSASFPCPAEMGGSIHIHGTNSSIVDTVFVCRTRIRTVRAWLFDDAKGLVRIMSRELVDMQAAGVNLTEADVRCVARGHITRMAIVQLKPSWDATLPTADKLEKFRQAMDAIVRVDSPEFLERVNAQRELDAREPISDSTHGRLAKKLNPSIKKSFGRRRVR